MLDQLGALSEIGAALELVIDRGDVVTLGFEEPSQDSARADYRVALERRPGLLWSPEWRALVVFLGARRKRRGAGALAEADAAALAARAKFHGSEPTGAYELVPIVGPEPWRRLGRGARIDYYSDKWGTREEYKHSLGAAVSVFLRGNFEAGVLAVQGGKLGITTAGIVG